MNNDKLKIRDQWDTAKARLKQDYSSLTDDDLKYVEGQEDELISRIQKRTGQTREAVVRTLRDCGC